MIPNRRQMSDDFAGKSAVVTGGGQGIGAAIAKGLAARGAHVFLSGRHAETLDGVCDEIRAAGGEADRRVGDVTDLAHLNELMALAAGSHGVIDILINNAGIAGPSAPLIDITRQEWEETIAVNLTGVFLACKAALPYLERAEHGKIVTIGSVTGKRPLPNRTPYAAAKLGVVGLARTLAHEVAPHGISVNVVSPGAVEGDRLERVVASMSKARDVPPETVRAELVEAAAFKRPVTEADVVETTLFLCSSAANNLTGQDINVSAGAVMY